MACQSWKTSSLLSWAATSSMVSSGRKTPGTAALRKPEESTGLSSIARIAQPSSMCSVEAFVAQAVSSRDMQIGSGWRQRALHGVDADLIDEDRDAGGHRVIEVGAVIHLESRMKPTGLAFPGLL